MAIQVWEYDGTPHLIMNPSDLPEEYTDLPPTDGLYYPVVFDPEKREWFGTEKDVWEYENPPEPVLPDDTDSLKKLIQLQTIQLANLTKEFQEFKGGTN
ncbi:hypothetical protein [Mammaliicoccus sciuri]|uniref:hypothetical protein n=1 Tax=Mammaliicoccus sciuri TaxID=1296 RepID=UPI0016283852|nr:hypothetical protein [Mammaliicoccus sciuri]